MGYIDANVGGGTTPYSYLWSNQATSQNINQLSQGDYSLMVTDNKGCQVNASTTIEDPSISAELYSPEICYVTTNSVNGFNEIHVNPIL